LREQGKTHIITAEDEYDNAVNDGLVGTDPWEDKMSGTTAQQPHSPLWMTQRRRKYNDDDDNVAFNFMELRGEATP
jgi:hypothetical protein